MKAIVLSAGLGTRLRPYTLTLPKVMMPVKDKPILFYHIQNLKEYGITDIGINLHYFPKKITEYFGDGSKFGVNIKYSREKELQGTSGAIDGFRDWIGMDDFLVVYGDNYSHFNYQEIIDFSDKEPKAEAIICLYEMDDLKGKGLVTMNKNGLITEFVEKPKNPEKYNTKLTNAGVYYFKNSILEYIPKNMFSDFSLNIFPSLIKKKIPLKGYLIMDNFIDIGTIKAYEKIK